MSLHKTLQALIADKLSAEGLTAATTYGPPYDGNVLAVPLEGPEENVPGLTVTLVPASGGEDIPFLGVATRHGIVRADINVRSELEDFEGGRELAAAIYGVVHFTALLNDYIDLGDSESKKYYVCVVIGPEPIYMGRTEERRHLWRMTVEARYTL